MADRLGSWVAGAALLAALPHAGALGSPLDRSGLGSPLDRSGLGSPLDRSGLGSPLDRSGLGSPLDRSGLDELLDRAAAIDPQAVQFAAEADAAAARVRVARADLLPRLSATAAYTRNEVATEVALPGQSAVIITPIDQLDAVARLDVPLVDLGSWSSLAAAGACSDAAQADATASTEAALLEVVRSAWDLRTALVADAAASAAIATDEQVLDQATARRDAGTGPSLDVLRATADLARTRGVAAGAGADVAAARRARWARTGVDALPDDLVARAPPDGDLDASALARPEVVAARATLACRSRSADAVSRGFAPSVTAFAQERVTNATGFSGRAGIWSAGAQLDWTPLDGGRRLAAVDEARADRLAAQAALDRQERQASDGLADARTRLEAAGLSASAARDRSEAATAAADDARTRFEAGTGGGVDVSLASGEALDAAVDLARAESGYAVAVEVLRVAAGRPLRMERR
ncbi:MAG: TolC family protein [Myxococcota bacterium]